MQICWPKNISSDKTMSNQSEGDENFVQESLHFQAVLLDKRNY